MFLGGLGAYYIPSLPSALLTVSRVGERGFPRALPPSFLPSFAGVLPVRKGSMWVSGGGGRCRSQLIATFLLSVSPPPHSLSIQPRKRRMRVSKRGTILIRRAVVHECASKFICEYGVIMGFGFNLFHIISAR